MKNWIVSKIKSIAAWLRGTKPVVSSAKPGGPGTPRR